MRVLFLGNNRLAYRCVNWLRGQGEEIVGVVVHPENRRTLASEIIEAAGTPSSAVFPGDRLTDPTIFRRIREARADIAVSILFGYILTPEFIKLFPEGVINLHPSYLPFNRGAYPNVWSIVDGTPAGVSLHYIDSGIDTGDLIARREVTVEPSDTGGTLYAKLERAGVEIFRDTWPAIRAGTAPRTPQPDGGTEHRVSDVRRIDEIDLDEPVRAGDLIDIIRARTFPPYRGAYFKEGDRRIYLRLELLPEEELEDGNV